jgi:hypothetical protein
MHLLSISALVELLIAFLHTMFQAISETTFSTSESSFTLEVVVVKATCLCWRWIKLGGTLAIPGTRWLLTIRRAWCKTCWRYSEQRIPIILANSVFLLVDQVPPLHEMLFQVLSDRPAQANGNITPSHAGILSTIQFILIRMVHLMEVHYARVVVVLTRKDNSS